MKLPLDALTEVSLTRVTQDFPRPVIADPAGEVGRELERLRPALPKGARIAVAAGSRGIANIAVVVKATIDWLKKAGAEPFVVPAMGSHGGATAEGQEELLSSYGITEEEVGAPVRSSMEVVKIADHELGFPVFMDKLAWESDGVVLINRVKPHTDYHGHPESGLMKMSVIGLGKHDQALAIHARGITGLKELIAPASRRVLDTGKVLFGIALLENAFDETMVVRAIPAVHIEDEERDLLEIARANMPSLPTEDVDVLIIDEMGKDVSGTGIDPNIIGRIRVPGQTEPDRPLVRSIMVCDLTEASHGNAIGVGLADVITRRLYERIDFPATYENVITSTFLDRGKIPLIAENDAIALGISLRSASVLDPRRARIVRIKNTLRLSEVWVSDALVEELSAGRNAQRRVPTAVHSDTAPLIGPDGTLPPVFA